jgi:hypothetical protein
MGGFHLMGSSRWKGHGAPPPLRSQMCRSCRPLYEPLPKQLISVLGGPHHTHRMHAALGGAATPGSQRLRVFVPHDFCLQTIRVAEEDAQGGAEVGNGAI